MTSQRQPSPLYASIVKTSIEQSDAGLYHRNLYINPYNDDVKQFRYSLLDVRRQFNQPLNFMMQSGSSDMVMSAESDASFAARCAYLGINVSQAEQYGLRKRTADEVIKSMPKAPAPVDKWQLCTYKTPSGTYLVSYSGDDRCDHCGKTQKGHYGSYCYSSSGRPNTFCAHTGHDKCINCGKTWGAHHDWFCRADDRIAARDQGLV